MKLPGFNIIIKYLLLPLLLACSTASFAGSNCTDYLNDDNDDKPFCVWLKNNTQETISIKSWEPYSNNADINDDYWLSTQWSNNQLVLEPGELKIVAGIDNDGWGVFNWGTIKFRGAIEIGGVTNYGIYMLADLRAGVVNDFEYGVSVSDSWHDEHHKENMSFGNKTYVVAVDDSYDNSRSMWDAMFSISDERAGPNGFNPRNFDNDVNKLNVMNFNTFLLFGPTTFGKPDYCERAKAIYNDRDRLFKNVDILVMNELASQESCTPDAEQLAVESYLCCDADKPFQDRTSLLNGRPSVSGLVGTSQTGGVIIMSRQPNSLSSGTKRDIDHDDSNNLNSYSVNDEVHYEFKSANDECSGTDCSMEKGYLKAKFTKAANGNSKDYYIIATHAQAFAGSANSDARKEQFKAMKMMANSLPQNAPIIYVGDLNIEADEWTTTNANLDVDIQKVSQSWMSKLEYSDDGHTNYYVFDEEGRNTQKKYDWVLPYLGGEQPVSQLSWVLPMTSTKSRIDLSDHHAVLSELSFETAEYRRLRNKESGKCLTAPNLSYGTNIAMLSCNNSNNQKWHFEPSTGYIRSGINTNYCLDNRGQTFNGGNLTLYPCTSHNNLKWAFKNGAARSANNENIVILSNGPTAKQSEYNGDNSQVWHWD